VGKPFSQYSLLHMVQDIRIPFGTLLTANHRHRLVDQEMHTLAGVHELLINILSLYPEKPVAAFSSTEAVRYPLGKTKPGRCCFFFYQKPQKC